MSSSHGTLYLVPNSLDFGTPGAPPDLQDVLPLGVIRLASTLGHWVAENAKTTRAFLKRVDAIVPLTRPLQSIVITEIPKAQKGRAVSDLGFDIETLLAPALEGHALGVISEAGLPAVADPGAAVVAAAHALGLRVEPLPGASSLLLALAASGLNGQSFAFVGYIPSDASGRATRIKEIEAVSRRLAQTQLIIETPYRNAVLHSALLEHLQATTRLSVSCGLTLGNLFVRTDRVAQWRAQAAALPAAALPTDVPAVFSLLAG